MYMSLCVDVYACEERIWSGNMKENKKKKLKRKERKTNNIKKNKKKRKKNLKYVSRRMN